MGQHMSTGWPADQRSADPHTPMGLLRPVSRRLFVKAALATLAGAGLWLMNTLIKRAGAIPETAENTVTVPFSPSNGIRFFEKVIIVCRDGDVAVFSSACPHLGCRINRIEDGEIACPCHGSRFNASGEIIHGPATRGLHALPFQLDRNAAVVRVTLDA
jgi:Rieske Fe-S protein